MSGQKIIKIIGNFSIREVHRPDDGTSRFGVYRKGAGPSHWNELVSIQQTKGGCWIVSSNRATVDAFKSWDEALKDALARAKRGHRHGED